MESNFNQLSNLKYNLNYYGADYPVDSLVKRMLNDEFIFPNYQRQYVWKIDEASKFIESLLLGLPVPSLFLAKDKYSNKLIVIDGQQRLRTLQFFYKGVFPDGKPFKLRNVIPEISGMTYEDLSLEDKFSLENTIIHCLIISESENSDSIFYLFERLNTTGSPLTNQEIRNAVYHGEFNSFLHELSETEIWSKLYHKNDIRQEKQELILRFIALNFEFDAYSGNLNDFLNEFMLKNRNFDIISKERIGYIFHNTFNIIYEALGSSAFYHNKQFNKSLFETLTLTISQHNLNDFERIKSFYRKLISDENFWSLSKSQTTSKKSLTTKLELAKNFLEINH